MSDPASHEPSPRTRAFVAWAIRFRGAILAVALLLAVPAVARTVSLYAHLKTEIEQLLPRDAPSVAAIEELRARIPGLLYLGVVVDVGDPKNMPAGEKLVDDLAAKIRAYPPEIARKVRTGVTEERAFLSRNAALYADLEDLQTVRARIEARRSWEVARELGTLLDDEDAPPSVDFTDIEKKYQARAPDGDRFPSGRFSSDKLHLTMLLVEVGEFGTGQTHSAELLKRVQADVAALGGPATYAPGMRVGYTGDVAISVEETAALVEDLSISSGLVIAAVVTVIILYYRWWRSDARASCRRSCSRPSTRVRRRVAPAVRHQRAELQLRRSSARSSWGTASTSRHRPARAVRGGSAARARRRGRVGVRPVERALEARSPPRWPPASRTRRSASPTSAASGSSGRSAASAWRSRGSCPTRSCRRSRRSSTAARRHRAEPEEAERRADAADRALRLGVPRRDRRRRGADHDRRRGACPLVQRVLELEYDLSKLRRADTWVDGEGYWGQRMDELLGTVLTPMAILADDEGEARAIKIALEDVRKKPPLDELIGSVRTIDDVLPTDQARKIAEVEDDPRRSHAAPPRADPGRQTRGRRQAARRGPAAAHRRRRPPGDVHRRHARRSATAPSAGLSSSTRSPRGRCGWAIRSSRSPPRCAASRRPRSRAGSPRASPATSSSRRTSSRRCGATARCRPGLAFFGVAGVVLLLFRRSSTSVLVLGSLATGVLWLAALAMTLGVKLNFTNFIAFPITFGIGVDYSVNVMTRYVQDGSSDVMGAVRSTGSAVVLCLSATTIIGYSSLLLAQNRALYLFGLMAVLGEITCLTTAVVALPAVLLWLKSRRS